MSKQDLSKLAEQLAEKRNRGHSWRNLWAEFEIDNFSFEEQNELQRLIEKEQQQKGYILR